MVRRCDYAFCSCETRQTKKRRDGFVNFGMISLLDLPGLDFCSVQSFQLPKLSRTIEIDN